MASIVPTLKRIHRANHSLSQCLTLLAIGGGSNCVTTLTEATGLGEWTIHHCLNALRADGLVKSKHRGPREKGARVSTHQLTPAGARYAMAIMGVESSPQPTKATSL